jgi:hypothetical protein
MYKKLLPSLILIGCTITSYAQSTLTGANFNPQIGDAFAIVNCVTDTVTPRNGGAAQNWDFTSLVTSSLDTGNAVPCTSTAHCAMFSGTTLAITSPQSDLVQYIRADASTLSQVGYYQSADTNLVLTNPMDEIRYPFTYPDTFTDTYSGTLTFSLATALDTGSVFVACDGYGTLNLPGGVTFTNALRVHSMQVFTDSTNLFATPTIDTFNISTYTWYVSGYHSALLTISYVTQVGASSSSYQLVSYAPRQVRVAGVPVVNGTGSSLNVYPNPVQNELNIDYDNKTNENVRITLVDMLGRQVAVIADGNSQTAQHLTYNTTGLTKGLYILHLQSGSETITKKIEIQ